MKTISTILVLAAAAHAGTVNYSIYVNTTSITGGSVPVGAKPILLENQ